MAGAILVRDMMTQNPRVVRRDTNIQELVATMNKFDISSAIVIEDERAVGLTTHKDIMSKIVQPHTNTNKPLKSSDIANESISA
jgi:predicted transcriptional regulator